MGLNKQDLIEFLSEKLKAKRYELCHDTLTDDNYFIFSKKDNNGLKEYKNNYVFDRWEKVFDIHYSKINGTPNSTNDTSVWVDSKTHSVIPKCEMNEWLNLTVSKISKYLNPKSKVLEIGCGNGLILQRIIQHIGEYIGIENSKYAIESIKNSSMWNENKRKIELFNLSAIDLHKLDYSNFDFIIINSVCQYFPNLDYLINVLGQLEIKLKEPSYIFIGDVRSYEMSCLQYIERSKDIANFKDIKKIISSFRQKERETLYSQEVLKYLSNIFPWVSSSMITKKIGHYKNEMNKYRFDVLIYCKHKLNTECYYYNSALYCWFTDKMNYNKMTSLISKLPENKLCIIQNYPNYHLEDLQKIYNEYFPDSQPKADIVNHLSLQNINNICEKNNVYMEMLTNDNPLYITLRFSKCPLAFNSINGINFAKSIISYSNRITGLPQQNFSKLVPNLGLNENLTIKQIDDKVFDLK